MVVNMPSTNVIADREDWDTCITSSHQTSLRPCDVPTVLTPEDAQPDNYAPNTPPSPVFASRVPHPPTANYDPQTPPTPPQQQTSAESTHSNESAPSQELYGLFQNEGEMMDPFTVADTSDGHSAVLTSKQDPAKTGHWLKADTPMDGKSQRDIE